MAMIISYRREESYNHIELPHQMRQHLLHSSALTSHEYSTINEYTMPEYALPTSTNATTTQTKPSHEYFILERPEELSNQSVTTQEAQLHVYSTPIWKERKKVATDLTSYDMAQHHWNGTDSVVHDGESNPTPFDAPSMTSEATYSTVVRQNGEKITIRIQAPNDST